jgi:isoquinoline 1-oxidoreductase alpha subunit
MVTLNINGRSYSYDGDPSVPLLWVLRDEIGLTGTKFGCGIGECGACTVHIGGQAVRSCQITAANAQGKAIITIEGLDPDGEHVVQRAWRQAQAPQCGYCHVGQIMQAAAMLEANKKPEQPVVLATMSGNICRCGCYQRIAEAITLASAGV